METRTVGACGLCGGRVAVFSGPWSGVTPPQPSCDNCGAIPAPDHGPVIKMQPHARPNHALPRRLGRSDCISRDWLSWS